MPQKIGGEEVARPIIASAGGEEIFPEIVQNL